MAAFWRPLAAGLILLAAATPGAAASPDPATLRVAPEETVRARALVLKLGSEIFRERDDATRELAAMGRRALAALDEARGDPDPEVSARVEQLRPRATLDEMAARVASFLADGDSRFEHDIPAWPRFRATLGDDAAARALFTELVGDRANYELLTLLGGAPAALTPGLTALAGGPAALRVESGGPAALRPALAARRRQLQAAANPQLAGVGGAVARSPSPAEFALVLLAESCDPVPETLFNPTLFNARQHFYAPGVKDAVTGTQRHSAALRTLTWLWLDSRPAATATVLGLGLYLQLDPARLAGYAARSLRQPTVNVYDRVSAITAITQGGNAEHLGALTAVFADDRAFFNQANVGGFDIRVCDFALATALRFTGQRPEDYGMAAQVAALPGRPVGSMGYYFKSDAKGTAGEKGRLAFGKWRTYEAGLIGGVAGGALADRAAAARYPEVAAKPDPKPAALPGD